MDMYVLNRANVLVLDSVLKRDLEITKGKDEPLITFLVKITIS